MKVLFVSSGNSEIGISPIVKNQGASLQRQGINITYFTINSKGIKGYLKSVRQLKLLLKEECFDVIHAHYSLSGFVASLAGAKPLVVSLMGSDVKSKSYYRFIIRFFHRFWWPKIIVKSEDMKVSLGVKNILVIPNGVDFKRFKPIVKNIAIKEIGWDESKKHILFAGNPKNAVKNFKLTSDSFNLINNLGVELHYLDAIPNNRMVFYYNSADVVILTSLWEGSPNVIKEAMACNRPIVATKVGDIEEIVINTNGCYLCESNTICIAEGLQKALAFDCQTNGREKILHLGIDSESIAKKISNLYSNLILNKKTKSYSTD